MDIVKEKWQQLNQREQWLAIAMSLFILVFLFTNLVWKPLNEGISQAESKIEKQKELLAWVHDKTSLISASGSGVNNTNSKGSISSIVNRTAQANNIVITRIQPQGDNIQVWIDQVVFSRFLQWLNQLTLVEGLHVKALDVSTTEQEGVVKIRRLQLGK